MTLSVLYQTTISQQVAEALGGVFELLPKLLAALLLSLLGFVAAKLVANALDGLLHRVGFDQAVQRIGGKKFFTRTEHDASQAVARIVSYIIMLVSAQLAFAVFGPNPVSASIQAAIAYLPRVVAALLCVVVAGVAAATVRELVSATLGGPGSRVVANAAATFIALVGLFAGLNQLRVAPAVVNALYYALLAIIVGSAVLAVGGAGIVPLRGYWERALRHLEETAPRLRDELRAGRDEAGDDQRP